MRKTETIWIQSSSQRWTINDWKFQFIFELIVHHEKKTHKDQIYDVDVVVVFVDDDIDFWYQTNMIIMLVGK